MDLEGMTFGPGGDVLKHGTFMDVAAKVKDARGEWL